jgi:probable lipoprotein (TIGR04455 family)
MIKRWWWVVCMAMVSCAHVRGVYTYPGYGPQSPYAIKRIAVASWAWPESEVQAQVLASVTRDLVKLRTHYLLYNTVPGVLSFTEACTDRTEGVLWVRAQDVQICEGKARVVLFVELYACKTGAMVWHAQASREVDVEQKHLGGMVGQYVEETGPQAQTLAGPFFVLMQEVVNRLPRPVLSDEDMMEKIESDL